MKIPIFVVTAIILEQVPLLLACTAVLLIGLNVIINYIIMVSDFQKQYQAKMLELYKLYDKQAELALQVNNIRTQLQKMEFIMSQPNLFSECADAEGHAEASVEADVVENIMPHVEE